MKLYLFVLHICFYGIMYLTISVSAGLMDRFDNLEPKDMEERLIDHARDSSLVPSSLKPALDARKK